MSWFRLVKDMGVCDFISERFGIRNLFLYFDLNNKIKYKLNIDIRMRRCISEYKEDCVGRSELV